MLQVYVTNLTNDSLWVEELLLEAGEEQGPINLTPKVRSLERQGLLFYSPIATATTNANTSSLGSNVVKLRATFSVQLNPFSLGDFTYPGGSISVLPNGVWYVGVDLFRKVAICLPRLGHRGWIPVAKVITSAIGVVSVERITPEMPATRIPRTIAKLQTGKPINVLCMGSSLVDGSLTRLWAGMLFNQASSPNLYRLPGTITLNNIGLGGTPNQYQLAQLGLASSFSAMVYADSGFPKTLGYKAAPNGRSNIFENVDLVVIGLLANGGDYRLDLIEPIIRRLRQRGVEVIVLTDNPQNPTNEYSTMLNTPLYVDGPEVMRIADLYGVELADTAAYVFEAHLRYGAGIYADTIHMHGPTNPISRTGPPVGGHEVWARAIRSVLHVDSVSYGSVSKSFGFDDTVEGFYGHVIGAASVETSKLKITKTDAASNQWGAQVLLPAPVKTGDTVVLTGTFAYANGYNPGSAPVAGLQGGGAGWASNQVALAPGAFSITLTASRDNVTDARLLLFGNLDNAPLNAAFIIDNLVITVNSTVEGAGFLTFKGRPSEITALPNCRVVSDLKTPGDAFITLPSDEYYLKITHANRGTLGAHPQGSTSFARRFCSSVSSTQDLLTLTTGKNAAIAAIGAVGFSLIYYSTNGDPAVTFDLYVNNTFVKTVTITAQTLSREMCLSLLSPTELNTTTAGWQMPALDIRVTSGTLKIAALIALTADIDFVPPEDINYSGTWSGKQTGGAPNMLGFATDTLDSYACMLCPPTGRRIGWICSSKPNSKMIDTMAGSSIATGVTTAGTNHVRVRGGHVGPNEMHYIRCAEALSGGGDSTNGYALHIGGAIVINDR